jgi:hypothetical protein
MKQTKQKRAAGEITPMHSFSRLRAFLPMEGPMQQTEFQKLLAVPYAEFDRRVREARLRAAGLEGVGGLFAAPAEIDAEAAERIAALVE